MYLHAFTDGSYLYNYAYYIVETEESFFRQTAMAHTSAEIEMLAMLALLNSPTVVKASGMTVFSDLVGVVYSTRRPTFKFNQPEGPMERLRYAIQEAVANLPYKPRIVLIEDSFNLAHRVTRNKRVTLQSGSKQQQKPNSDRRARRRGSYAHQNERIIAAEAAYLRMEQQAVN